MSFNTESVSANLEAISNTWEGVGGYTHIRHFIKGTWASVDLGTHLYSWDQ